MKSLTILSGKAMVVEVPEESYAFDIVGSTWLECHRHTDDLGFTTDMIDLPPGNWRIIGMLSEVTDDDLINIIDVLVSSKSGKCLFPNFTGGPWKTNRIESLESAILAEGWYFENPVKIHTWASENADDYRKQWEEGKKRVLCRSRCLLLGRSN